MTTNRCSRGDQGCHWRWRGHKDMEVCVCLCASRGAGCVNPLTATCHSPLRPSGPSVLSAHSLYQWELVWQWRWRGREGSRCQFLHFCFPSCVSPSHLSSSTHPSSSSFILFLFSLSILSVSASWHLFTLFSLWQTQSHMFTLTSTAALEKRYCFNTATGLSGSKTVHQGLIILPLQYVAWRLIDKKLRSEARKESMLAGRSWVKTMND